MDSNRFDSLTRIFASRLSRRAAIEGAAGLLTAVGLRQGADAHVSQVRCGNQMCARDPGVCTDGCICCVYPNGNSRCRPPGTCSPGESVCPAGEVVDLVAGCVTTTITTTTPPPCPSGYESIDGACYQITGPGFPACPRDCRTAGSIVQTGNFLCVSYTGPNCDANSFCGPGLVCQYGGTTGRCASAC